MIVKILISPDSFKECISSVKLSSLIKEEFDDLQGIETIVRPISDGGDGFLEVCQYHFGGEILSYQITTPYDNSEFGCPVLYSENFKTIYIESANVLGLKVVPAEFRNPLILSSKGLGELLLKIENDTITKKIAIEQVVIGIGGTATMDMGIGACSALGLQLFDEQKDEILPIPKNFIKTDYLYWVKKSFPFKTSLVIDVDNPLLGKDGSATVFGKQKGASEKEIKTLENSFDKITNLLQNNKLVNSANKLYGAGGGIPSIFNILLQANIKKAKEFILDDLGFKDIKDKLNFVITGEGAFDIQSGMGKGAGIIINQFKKSGKKIFLFCGKIDEKATLNLPKNVSPIEIIKFFPNRNESILNIESGIRLACIKIKNNLLL